MANSYGSTRKVSMAYILGFSDKPFKEAKPPPPPRPPQPSNLARMVTTPGGIIEWTASDGRKGTLTGSGKQRLTAATLAKIPSEKRSTKDASAAKSVSKKTATNKAASNGGDSWGAAPDFGGGWDTGKAKSGSKKSASKKAASNTDDAWGLGAWDATAAVSSPKSGSKKAASNSGDAWAAGAWDTGADATGGDDKKDGNDGALADLWTTLDLAADNKDEKKDDEKKVGEKKVGEKKVEEKKDDNDASSGWTKQQDEKMMQMKTDDAKVTWAKVAEEVGKPQDECKEHFKTIKPKDWRPNLAQKGGGSGGGGDGGKKGKNKGKGQSQGGNNKGSKKEEKKEDASGGAEGNAWDTQAGGDEVLGGGDIFGTADDDKKDSGNNGAGTGANNVSWSNPGGPDITGGNAGWGDSGGRAAVNHTGGGGWDKTGAGKSTGGGDTTWANADTSGGGRGTGNDVGVGRGWDDTVNTGGGGGVDAVVWGTTNNQTNKTGGDSADAWDTPAPAKSASKAESKSQSNKPPSQSRSHHPSHNTPLSTTARPLELEIKPDETFSADDLRLVARILQQDCSMVWERVSWRFRDKTGRKVPAEVFEKKITGYVEGKGSERGSRRGR
ncbi:hypothetical protein EJ02DRAFT_438669 [Clathrospora elynae]|uniref:Myb-like domain-containing protein n=1 Tax=Clathrospora elynae TaxID=706981 RepID=A0A6A5S8Z1_9PLEO|nr:hypothetical protein EJ02DRAFT_438669 [Clathrospora elynae]